MESEGKTIIQYMRWSCPHKNAHTHTHTHTRKTRKAKNTIVLISHSTNPIPPTQLQLKLSFLVFFFPLAAILATPTRERKKRSTPMVWARLKPLAPKGFLEEHLHPHYPISLALSRAFWCKIYWGSFSLQQCDHQFLIYFLSSSHCNLVITKFFFVEFSLQPCDHQFFFVKLTFQALLLWLWYALFHFLLFFGLHMFLTICSRAQWFWFFFPPFHLRFFELLSMAKRFLTLFHCQLSLLKVCHGVPLMHRLHVIF